MILICFAFLLGGNIGLILGSFLCYRRLTLYDQLLFGLLRCLEEFFSCDFEPSDPRMQDAIEDLRREWRRATSHYYG